MVLEVYESGIQTMGGTTQTFNTSHIKGKILKLQIVSSVSNTFRVWIDASDTNTKAIVDEDIFGTVGSPIAVNTSLNIYPVVAQKTGGDGLITDPDQYTPIIVDDILEVTVASGASADTWSIVIWYDTMAHRGKL